MVTASITSKLSIKKGVNIPHKTAVVSDRRKPYQCFVTSTLVSLIASPNES
jgi:hypothetical protein